MTKQKKLIFGALLGLGALMVSQEAVQASCGVFGPADKCRKCCSSKGMSNCDGCGGPNNPGVCKKVSSHCSCCEKQASIQIPHPGNPGSLPPGFLLPPTYPNDPNQNIPGQVGIGFPSAPPPPVQQPSNPDLNIPGQVGISFPPA